MITLLGLNCRHATRSQPYFSPHEVRLENGKILFLWMFRVKIRTFYKTIVIKQKIEEYGLIVEQCV